MPQFTSKSSKDLHQKRKTKKVQLKLKNSLKNYQRKDRYEFPVVTRVRKVPFRYLDHYSTRTFVEKSIAKRGKRTYFPRVNFITNSGRKLHPIPLPKSLPSPEYCNKSIASDEVASTQETWEVIFSNTVMPPTFTIHSRILDACPGDGGLSRYLKLVGYKNVTNLPEGDSCFSYIKANHARFDFVVTNPPWSKGFTQRFMEYLRYYRLGYALLVAGINFKHDECGPVIYR